MNLNVREANPNYQLASNSIAVENFCQAEILSITEGTSNEQPLQ